MSSPKASALRFLKKSNAPHLVMLLYSIHYANKIIDLALYAPSRGLQSPQSRGALRFLKKAMCTHLDNSLYPIDPVIIAVFMPKVNTPKALFEKSGTN